MPFTGQLGMAPGWERGACNKDCQETISACVLAHVNTSGQHIALWLDGDAPSLGYGRSAAYPFQEGSFFGNIFTSPPKAYYCNGKDFDFGVVPGRLGGNQAGSPYQNPFGSNGACATSCTAADAPYGSDGYKACNNFKHVMTVYRDFDPNTQYVIENYGAHTWIDVYNFSTADGGNIEGWSPNNLINQRWYIKRYAPGQYQIISALSGKCMDVAGRSTAAETNVQQWTCNGGANQLWQLLPQGGGWYQIRSVLTANTSSPMCLDLKSASATPGTNIQQYNCGAFGAVAQKWMIYLPSGQI